MKELILLSWRNLWRNKTRTAITASAIGLGLGLFLLAYAFTNGFLQYAVNAAAGSTIGHAQIHAPEYRETKEGERVIPDYKKLMAAVENTAGVKAVSPRHYAEGLAVIGDRMANIEVMGIDFERERSVTTMKDSVVVGEWPSKRQQVLIGKKLAEKLEVDIGGKFVITSAAAESGEMTSSLFRVAGFVATASVYLDQRAVITHIDDARELSALGDSAHELAMILDADPSSQESMEAVLAPLKSENIKVETWLEINTAMAQALKLNKQFMAIGVLMIFLIIALGILNTLAMSFLERYREFGVLRAIGTSPVRLASMILIEACFLGVVGVLFGSTLGYLINLPLEKIGMVMGTTEMHGMSLDQRLYSNFQWSDALVLSLVFTILTILTSLFTAIRAARIQPTEALRH